MEQKQLWDNAEELRKEGNYAEAMKLLEALEAERPAASITWRKLHCLRKLKKFEEAASIAKGLVEAGCSHEQTRREMVWLMYEMVVKPAIDKDEPNQILSGTQRMITLGADGIALRVAVLAAMAAAIELKKFEKVLRLANLINSDELPIEPRVMLGKKLPSWRELFFFRLLRGLRSLEKWEDMRLLAIRASEEFPRRREFARQGALALFQTDPPAGLCEMEKLAGHPRAPWYFATDVAERLAESERPGKAWVWACRAALRHGDDQVKVQLYALMATLAVRLGRIDEGVSHAALALAIRKSEGWPPSNALVELLQAHAIGVKIDTDITLLRLKCVDVWQKTDLQQLQTLSVGM